MGKRAMRKNSIRTRLLKVFMIVSASVFAVNIYIYYNLNKTIKEIDSVYSSNIQLNELSGLLENVQNELYQYLNTKSSDSLESYYTYEQDYRNYIERLNKKTVSETTLLTEKNIFRMSETYLEQAGTTVEAKRGRNITKYKETYKETEMIYEFLQASIRGMNTTVFLENSNNYSILRKTLNYLVWLSILLLCAVMAIATVWLVLMTRTITSPLVKLADAANEIAKGNMEADFPIVERKDEISTVAKACNKMISSIRTYITETTENYKRENQLKENELIMKNDLKEAQLKYLQAQINPHFLFNSLNAGAQLAMMEGAERACMFIENMADFFRYNVRKMNKDTTLMEEIAMVDNYIYILNVRFSGDIHFTKQIDERLLSVTIPSMIIQPLIENAVNHGIRELEGPGEIRLSVYSEEQCICVNVTDNGTGIKTEVIDKIMRGENAHSKEQKDSAGIGIDNVINRLKRYYNVEHVIRISRVEAGGTEVILCIPKVMEGDGYDENFNL